MILFNWNQKKNILKAVITLAILGVMAGCGNDTSKTADRSANTKSAVEQVLEEQIAADDAKRETSESKGTDDGILDLADSDMENSDKGNPDKQNEDAGLYSDDKIDVDLSSMSGSMVYAQVYDIMVNSDDYIGKVIRMEGTFFPYHEEATNTDYYNCIIQDATACCSQGIEFEPYAQTDEASKLPEDGEDVTVTGVFDTYMDGEYMYCTLRNAVVAN